VKTLRNLKDVAKIKKCHEKKLTNYIRKSPPIILYLNCEKKFS